MAADQPDDATLAELYRLHHARLVALAAHVIGESAAAEDCVQEAFVRLGATSSESVRSPGWVAAHRGHPPGAERGPSA